MKPVSFGNNAPGSSIGIIAMDITFAAPGYGAIASAGRDEKDLEEAGNLFLAIWSGQLRHRLSALPTFVA